MKKSIIITLLCAVMCMATGVSIANGTAYKPSPGESKTLVYCAPTATSVDAYTGTTVTVVNFVSVCSAKSPVFSASNSISKEAPPYAIPIKQGTSFTYSKTGITTDKYSTGVYVVKSKALPDVPFPSSAYSKYIYSACRPPLKDTSQNKGNSGISNWHLAVSELSPGDGSSQVASNS